MPLQPQPIARRLPSCNRLRHSAAEVLAQALADGQAALAAANKTLAIERFDLALLIDKQNSAAVKGRERALNLDKVLALVEQAADYELAADWQNALRSFEAALAVDADWPAAREGRDAHACNAGRE